MGTRRNSSFIHRSVIWTAVWWLWMPVVYLLFYAFTHVIMPGWKINQRVDQNMMAHIWSGGVLLWWMLAIGFIGTFVIWCLYGYDYTYDRSVKTTMIISGVLVIVASTQIFRTTWDNDKDLARYYNRSTVFYAPDTAAVPQSLTRLVKNGQVGDGQRCDLRGGHDVPSCIKQGELAQAGWDPRVGSLDGAIIAIKRRSGDVQKVSLAVDTVTYLNAWKDHPARWSGVLDGSGITQPLGGVSEWSGEGEPTQCLFNGSYAIDRAFHGRRSNSLHNLLAEKFPSLRYNLIDVWGYCDGQEPIVVVPVIRQVYFKDRTVDTAAGVITVRGDNSDTKLQYLPTVKAGDFPGPVYPMSLAAKQRQESEWAAGRQNRNRNGFGFEPVTSDVQAGNVSEYLLRNSATGRLEWVTPLTLRHSTSELIVAYSVVLADEVNSGWLNQLSIYALADNDPRRVNIDNLEADAKNYFATNAGTFISNGGKLVEFTPINGTEWRAFGELNGQVVYRLDISADKSITPRLVSLNNQPTSEVSDNTICGKPLNELTPTDLTVCLKLFAEELEQKLVNQGGTPSD